MPITLGNPWRSAASARAFTPRASKRAPGVELVGANAELDLDHGQALGDIVGSAPPMPAMHCAVIGPVAAFHLAVMPGPLRVAFGGFGPGRGEESETGDAEHRHDQERDKSGNLHGRVLELLMWRQA